MTHSSRISHRIAFLTRNVARLDLSHVRDINRIMASRNNFANDRRANDLRTKITEAFVAINS